MSGIVGVWSPEPEAGPGVFCGVRVLDPDLECSGIRFIEYLKPYWIRRNKRLIVILNPSLLRFMIKYPEGPSLTDTGS